MGRVIILEGADGTGKTTLARELEKRGWVYKHEGPPRPGQDMVAHYLKQLNDSIESEQDVVHDRLWLGERIYGRVARNNDSLGDVGQKLFMRLHNSKRIRQFVCLPGITTAYRAYERKIKERDDYLKCMDKFERVYEEYRIWWNMHGHQFDLYDYAHHDVNTVLGRPFFDKPLPTGTVGHPLARVLFIGDRPNHPFIDVPFHALNGSSGYFNEAIKMAGIIEGDLAISNARSPTGDWHDPYLLLNRLPMVEDIFLMGKIAERWWIDSGIQVFGKMKVYQIEHPSYLKRFYGNNPIMMATKIMELRKWRYS